MVNDTKLIELLHGLDSRALLLFESATDLASTNDQKLLVQLAAAVCIELAETRSALTDIKR